MASARSVAIRQAEALAGLQAACEQLGQVAGVDAPDLAQVRGRDPGIEHVLRLEALAGFVAEALVGMLALAALPASLSGEGSRKRR